ncbi:MAG: 3-hydroxyacyl-CoA dehydrogenase NAD-binding domain-containing protein [Bacteroidota bacterium]
MKTIAVIGAGTMGSGIAQVALTNQCKVYLYDVSETVLQKAKSNIEQSLSKLVEKQKITSSQKDIFLQNLHLISSFDIIKDAELVIEAIIENLDAKKNLFKEIEKYVSSQCILATNTSSLSVHSMIKELQYPNRFLGIHFFNPAPLMPLVEVIPTILTDNNITQLVLKTLADWGKTTVVAKDTPGFIVNRIARPFYSEALRIYDEGITDFVTIDWTMKNIGGFRMGPFELMDLIGHDVNYVVTETVWTQMYYDPKYKPSITQKRLLEAGLLGRKTGRGFYNYSQPLPTEPNIKDENLHHQIFMRILSMLINEAADALYYNIASREDIETAMTKGVNYPKGLLHWADELGISTIYNELMKLYDWYQEDRYRPSVLLKQKINNKQNFF